MATKPRDSQATKIAADQALIDGLTKHAATLATLLVAGSKVETSDLVTVLEARIEAIKAAIAARAALAVAVAAMNAELARTAALVAGTRQTLKAAFAGQADLLGDFGFKLPKARTPLTAEQKARAAAKARATFEANHPNAGKKRKGAAAAPAGAQPAPAPGAPRS